MISSGDMISLQAYGSISGCALIGVFIYVYPYTLWEQLSESNVRVWVYVINSEKYSQDDDLQCCFSIKFWVLI